MDFFNLAKILVQLAPDIFATIQKALPVAR
jgi:hypothetical protein